jgi:hypothetical protein
VFRLLHRLYPVQAELARCPGARLGPGRPGSCSLCKLETDETLLHAFFACANNFEACDFLRRVLEQVLGTVLTGEDVLLLQLHGYEADEVDRAGAGPGAAAQYKAVNLTSRSAAVFVIGTGLKAVWLARTKHKRMLVQDMKAELTARCNILLRASLNSKASLILRGIAAVSSMAGGPEPRPRARAPAALPPCPSPAPPAGSSTSRRLYERAPSHLPRARPPARPPAAPDPVAGHRAEPAGPS